MSETQTQFHEDLHAIPEPTTVSYPAIEDLEEDVNNGDVAPSIALIVMALEEIKEHVKPSDDQIGALLDQSVENLVSWFDDINNGPSLATYAEAINAIEEPTVEG